MVENSRLKMILKIFIMCLRRVIVMKMTRIKISAVDDLKSLRLLKKLTSKSKATDKDIEELSKKIKRGIAERHGLVQ